jgi:ABC-2 type transport system ATP-binding protein
MFPYGMEFVMSLLNLKNVNYTYDGVVTVLKDVTLTVDAGSIVGFMGPNGSGKSTLIKNVFDLLKLQSGRILIDGYPHSSADAKNKAMYLASNDYLPQFLTAEEYIKTLANLYDVKADNKSIRNFFLQFSMEARSHDLIENYSHGMRKKTQLISALMMRRPLTVIDETLNGIDLEALYILKQELSKLREEKKSILLCTHDFSLLEKIADRIIFLDLGSIVYDCQTNTLLEEYGSLAGMVSKYLDIGTR